MPVVRVSFYEGRTDEQKRQLAEIFTDAMVNVAGSTRKGVHVIFEDIPRSNWYIGLGADNEQDKKTT